MPLFDSLPLDFLFSRQWHQMGCQTDGRRDSLAFTKRCLNRSLETHEWKSHLEMRPASECVSRLHRATMELNDGFDE
jgi:hypothetical protein